MGAKSKFWGRIRAASVHLENVKQAKQPDFHQEKYHNWIDVDHSSMHTSKPSLVHPQIFNISCQNPQCHTLTESYFSPIAPPFCF